MRAVVTLVCLPILFGCGRDVVVSSQHPTDDGRVAFILDLNKSDGGFELRAVRPAESEYEAVTEMAVSQCANGQLFWDGKNSVVFAFDFAEIRYQVSGHELGVDLSIETCTRGTIACTAVMTSNNYGPPIDNVCSDKTG